MNLPAELLHIQTGKPSNEHHIRQDRAMGVHAHLRTTTPWPLERSVSSAAVVKHPRTAEQIVPVSPVLFERT